MWKDGNDTESLQMGMIAQEVEKVVPEVVHTANDAMKTKAVEYQYLVGLLVEAVKELKGKNEIVQKDNTALKAENSKLKESLLAMGTRIDAIEDMFLAQTTKQNKKLAKLN